LWPLHFAGATNFFKQSRFVEGYTQGMSNPRYTVKLGIVATLVAVISMLCPPVQAQPLHSSKPSISQTTKVPACILKGKRLSGSVFIANSKYSANFSVFQGSSKYSTDLSVFSTNSKYSATTCGVWYFTNSKYNADFSVYFVNSKYNADFSVYFVNSKYNAGTN